MPKNCPQIKGEIFNFAVSTLDDLRGMINRIIRQRLVLASKAKD
jgi:hypothetical protein